MSSQEKSSVRPSRVVVVVALVTLAAATLGLTLLLALSPAARALSSPQAHLLQVANFAVSGAALVLAAGIAWKFFRGARTTAAGMITVCAWTRRVLWEGRWISFEEYLAQRFNVRCTHGICDEAAEKLRAATVKSEIPPELRRSPGVGRHWAQP